MKMNMHQRIYTILGNAMYMNSEQIATAYAARTGRTIKASTIERELRFMYRAGKAESAPFKNLNNNASHKRWRKAKEQKV